MKTHFPTVPLQEAMRCVQAAKAKTERAVVFVIDNEPVLAETSADILSRSGIKAVPLHTCSKALKMAAAFPPDLVVAEMLMPGMRGADLAVKMRKVAPRSEIVFTTSLVTRDELFEAKRIAKLGYISLLKPVHPRDLVTCVQRRLAMRGSIDPARKE